MSLPATNASWQSSWRFWRPPLVRSLTRLLRALRRAAAPVPAAQVAKRAATIPVRAPAATARGFADPRQRAGTKRIAMTLDDATFQRVRDYAAGRQTSFAAAARELIERGCAAEAANRHGDAESAMRANRPYEPPSRFRLPAPEDDEENV